MSADKKASPFKRDDLVEVLEDEIAVERLTKQKRDTDVRARRLAESGYSAREIERVEALRRECIQLLHLVLAASSRVEVVDGAVQCVSMRADEFHDRLARFNRVNPGKRESLAAHYLRRIHSGEVI